MKLKFTLDIQFFASKKGVSSTKNGRDSAGRRLGAKKADGQFGKNVMRGGDDTLFATCAGIVKYERLGRDKKQVSVYPQAA